MIPGTIYRWGDSGLLVMFFTPTIGMKLCDDKGFAAWDVRQFEITGWCSCLSGKWKFVV
jgi:hypothetical protein